MNTPSTNRHQWLNFGPTVAWRNTALNILTNHMDEAVALNKKIDGFVIVENKERKLLSVERFLARIVLAKLPYTQKAIDHFHHIVQQWPIGTVYWEDLSPEKNPYTRKDNGNV